MTDQNKESKPTIGDLLEGEEYAGGVAVEVIATAERELGVRFPADYRRFLADFGSATFRGYEIWGLPQTVPADGISDGPPLWSDILRESSMVRRASGASIPKSLIPISSDGGDFRFYLDAECSGQEHSTIRVLGPGKDGPIVGRTLVDFLMTLEADSW